MKKVFNKMARRLRTIGRENNLFKCIMYFLITILLIESAPLGYAVTSDELSGKDEASLEVNLDSNDSTAGSESQSDEIYYEVGDDNYYHIIKEGMVDSKQFVDIKFTYIDVETDEIIAIDETTSKWDISKQAISDVTKAGLSNEEWAIVENQFVDKRSSFKYEGDTYFYVLNIKKEDLTPINGEITIETKVKYLGSETEKNDGIISFKLVDIRTGEELKPQHDVIDSVGEAYSLEEDPYFYVTDYTRTTQITYPIDFTEKKQDITVFYSKNKMHDGWLNEKGEAYYIVDGQTVKGQYKIDGQWYLFDKITGAMQIGFRNLSSYGQNKTVYYNSKGQMVKGQQYVSGQWYLFDKITGAMQIGFRNLSSYGQNKTVYYDSKGQMVKGQQYISGQWYLFDKITGAMQIGFRNLSSYGQNKTVYYNSKGQMVKGQQKIKGHWYLLDEKTGAIKYGRQYIAKQKKWVLYNRTSGTMLYGLQKDQGNTYLFDSGTGAMKYGWQMVNRKKRYFDKRTGIMSTHTVVNGINYYNDILIANKKNKLPSNYAPGEDKSAGDSFRTMNKEMRRIGLDVSTSYSGYRSYQTQANLYNNYVAIHGRASADTFSARAGYSEHQTGLAFDFINGSGQLVQSTRESNWIRDNAWKYGFIVRYPANKVAITGYQYEPWHVRYVGSSSLAKSIKDSGKSLEEYVGASGGGY